MALRRRASTAGLRRFAGRTRRRASSYKKSGMKRDLKRAGLGAAAGLLVSIPLTLLGRHYNQPLAIEAGQRVGSIVSTAAGGTPGNAAYQGADALFDRFVRVNGQGITGSQGQVYL